MEKENTFKVSIYKGKRLNDVQYVKMTELSMKAAELIGNGFTLRVS